MQKNLYSIYYEGVQLYQCTPSFLSIPIPEIILNKKHGKQIRINISGISMISRRVSREAVRFYLLFLNPCLDGTFYPDVPKHGTGPKNNTQECDIYCPQEKTEKWMICSLPAPKKITLAEVPRQLQR
jgi:hypothetical protein